METKRLGVGGFSLPKAVANGRTSPARNGDRPQVTAFRLLPASTVCAADPAVNPPWADSAAELRDFLPRPAPSDKQSKINNPQSSIRRKRSHDLSSALRGQEFPRSLEMLPTRRGRIAQRPVRGSRGGLCSSGCSDRPLSGSDGPRHSVPPNECPPSARRRSRPFVGVHPART